MPANNTPPPPLSVSSRMLASEQIAKHYSACMDSVNLINGTKPEFMTDAEWKNVLTRNYKHLQIMLERPIWTTQDLAPLHAAVATAKALTA